MKIFYLRDKNNHPVACIISDLKKEGVAFAVSTHNPIDPFSKRIAREVASGRLYMTQKFFMVDAGHNVKGRILQMVARCGNLPNRTRDAAKLWLEKAKTKAAAA